VRVSRQQRVEAGDSPAYFIGSTTTAVPYASTSVTPCMISVAS
jgi:hypothetical protein